MEEQEQEQEYLMKIQKTFQFVSSIKIDLLLFQLM